MACLAPPTYFAFCTLSVTFVCCVHVLHFISTFTVTVGEVTVTMDTTTKLSENDEEDKREQSDYL